MSIATPAATMMSSIAMPSPAAAPSDITAPGSSDKAERRMRHIGLSTNRATASAVFGAFALVSSINSLAMEAVTYREC